MGFIEIKEIGINILTKKESSGMVGARYLSRFLLKFEYNNYKMGKKSFVRVKVGTK